MLGVCLVAGGLRVLWCVYVCVGVCGAACVCCGVRWGGRVGCRWWIALWFGVVCGRGGFWCGVLTVEFFVGLL